MCVLASASLLPVSVLDLTLLFLHADIGECVKVLRDTAEDEGLAPIPIFGNGDAYDWRTYWDNVEGSGVDGIMIARGALIKPWCFTEIKERRDCASSPPPSLFLLDPSRPDEPVLVRRGHLVARAPRHDRQAVRLRHGALGASSLSRARSALGPLADEERRLQGADQMGLNKTRRFVAESLSFTHRYVPVGLLERLPTNMNERAFPYKGRDELEVRPLTLSFARPVSLCAKLTTSTTRRRSSPRTRPRTGSRSARCSSARRPTTGTLSPRCARFSLHLSLPFLTDLLPLQHKAASTETEAQG